MTFYLQQNLKLLREAKRLTQKEFSKALFISPQAYCHYENGRRTPSLSMLCRMADFYSVTLDQLVRHRISVHSKIITTIGEQI